MSSSPIEFRRPSRPRRAAPSRIPKPQFNGDASARGGAAPGPNNAQGPSAPPSTPVPLAKLDAAFAAAVDHSRDHNWLIGAGPGAASDGTDSLLEAAEWRECEDDGRSLHSHYDESDEEEREEGFSGGRRYIDDGGDCGESRGSCSPPEEARGGRAAGRGPWGPMAALEAVAGRLGRLAWTLEWLAALRAPPAEATPRTPAAAPAPAAPPGGGPSGGSAASCRSLSAAFDLAALEPGAFRTRPPGGAPRWGGSGGGGATEFASACSASAAGGSDASDADSEELHASLGTSVAAAAAVSEWLSGGGAWAAPPPP